MSENPKIVSVGSLETVNGSHEFTIQGYSLTKGMGIGNYIASDTFTVGGYEWAVYFYPNGIIPSENSDTYVSFFIALVSEGSDVRALFELTMFDQTGRERHKVHSHFDRIRLSSDLPLERHKVHSLFDPYPKYLPYTLKWRGSKWGYRRYYRREMLETSDFIKNDCLKIKCTVGVVVGTVPRPRLHSGNVQESEHNTTTSPAEKRERDATEEDGTADNFSIKPPFVKLKITLKIQLKKRERDATEEDVIAVC